MKKISIMTILAGFALLGNAEAVYKEEKSPKGSEEERQQKKLDSVRKEMEALKESCNEKDLEEALKPLRKKEEELRGAIAWARGTVW